MFLNLRLVRMGLWAAALVSMFAACAGGPPKSPNPTQPVDELRARALIAEVVREANAQPEQGRTIHVGVDQVLNVDIGVIGKKHGIAYVTEAERRELGPSIPPPDLGSNALRVVRDDKDPETVILLLHDTSYVADDQMGSEREVTGIMAERKLKRDVRDFLVQTRAKQWE